jgi:hypothetical protein
MDRCRLPGTGSRSNRQKLQAMLSSAWTFSMRSTAAKPRNLMNELEGIIQNRDKMRSRSGAHALPMGPRSRTTTFLPRWASS